MTISLDFPTDVENTLRQRAAAAGQDVATFVKEVVFDHLAEEAPTPTKPSKRESFEDWMRAWIKLHPVLPTAVDDSRESIYAGCGE